MSTPYHTGMSLSRVSAFEVWPYYLVFDTSHSMGDRSIYPDFRDELPIDMMQRYVEEIVGFLECPPEQFGKKLRSYRDTFGQEPTVPVGDVSRPMDMDDLCAVQARIYLSVLSFNSSVSIVRPLGPLDPYHPTGGITFTASGETNYAAVFDTLRTLIPADAERIRSTGSTFQTPAVIFFTDGKPQVDGQYQWRRDAHITHFRWGVSWLHLQEIGQGGTASGSSPKGLAPGIVSIGIGDADGDNLRALATPHHGGMALKAKAGAPINVLILRIMEGIVGSIAGTATGAVFRFPQLPEFEKLEGKLGMTWSRDAVAMPAVPPAKIERR